LQRIIAVRRPLTVSVFSGVDRARRRQQSEFTAETAPNQSRPLFAWPITSRYAATTELRNTAQATPLEVPARADVVVVGVPGIGKAAVCEFLGRHGLKAADVELKRGQALPDQLKRARGLIVALMMRSDRLIAERRMRTAAQPDRSADIDPDAVREELVTARRLFTGAGWHIIDISHQSPSAVAARIVALLQRRQIEAQA
jgi:hypothetical protein